MRLTEEQIEKGLQEALEVVENLPGADKGQKDAIILAGGMIAQMIVSLIRIADALEKIADGKET